MDRLFEVQDKSGRKIYLSKERWQHIAGEHPEIAPFLEEIKATLSQPTKFAEYESDKAVRYYYKYFKTGSAPANYLLTIGFVENVKILAVDAKILLKRSFNRRRRAKRVSQNFD